MRMPSEVLCEKCGAEATVLTREFDEHLLSGKLPASDNRLEQGFRFEINCPNCGPRWQALAPPP
jgi:hypothetical protein